MFALQGVALMTNAQEMKSVVEIVLESAQHLSLLQEAPNLENVRVGHQALLALVTSDVMGIPPALVNRNVVEAVQ